MINELIAKAAATSGTSATSLNSLIILAAELGINPVELEADVRSLVEERIAFWLIGNVRPRQNFRDRQGTIRRRMKALADSALGSAGDIEHLVDHVAKLQARIDDARRHIRAGASSIDEPTSLDLFDNQGNRCAVCGVPLKPVARRLSDRFPDGREPLGEATLEHRTPYYLVGNDTDFEILCRDCNGLKNDRIGVHEDGLVVSGNTLRPRDKHLIRRRSIFWTCYKTRGCSIDGCAASPSTTMIFASRISASVPLMLGNIALYCEMDAPPEAQWLHAPNLDTGG